ncbi:MAG: zinc-ribbon domain-containing protein [Oscillospiraceae bacterium]|nr:zinc-ribbon domain-containing protein [Oscillospiraceae bacterium]
MSNFFDQLSTGFTNASRTVSQKVKNLNDTNKLTSQVKTEQNNIHQNLVAIGQKYYDLCRDNPDEEFRGMVEAIIKSEQTIARLQQEIESVRAREPELMPVPEQQTIGNAGASGASDFRTCPNCGSRSQGDSAFCSHCGQKLAVQAAQYDKIYQQNPASSVQNSVNVVTEEQANAAQASAVEPEPEPEYIDAQITEPEFNSASAFCPYCGKKLSVPGARFCSECGSTL